MKGRIRNLGNRLVLRTPKSSAVASKIEQGAAVDIRFKNRSIVVKPVRESKHALENLVDAITDENRHDETDGSRPVGREAI